jgi:hypothetical protein
MLAAGEALQQQQGERKDEIDVGNEQKSLEMTHQTKKEMKQKTKQEIKQETKSESQKESKKNALVPTSTPTTKTKTKSEEKKELMNLHAFIGMAFGAAVGYRKKEHSKNSETDNKMNFIDWFRDVHVLSNQCKDNDVVRDKMILDLKTSVRSKANSSTRVFWFGTMLGWLPPTKDFPFSHDTASAYLDVLEASGLVSSFEYQVGNPSTETPKLCHMPCIVNEHALIKAIGHVFQKSGTDQEEEVTKCQSRITTGAFAGKTDLDLCMHLFMECWFAVVGRFKAQWQDDEAPSSPKETKGPG